MHRACKQLQQPISPAGTAAVSAGETVGEGTEKPRRRAAGCDPGGPAVSQAQKATWARKAKISASLSP